MNGYRNRSRFVGNKEFLTIQVIEDIKMKELEELGSLIEVLKMVKEHENSKQLYPAYEKILGERLSTLIANRVEKKLIRGMGLKRVPDLRIHRVWDETENRSIYLSYSLSYRGKEYGGLDMFATKVAIKHLNRCVAILIDKGYIYTSIDREANRFKKGGELYQYQVTNYHLTKKAVARLQKEGVPS